MRIVARILQGIGVLAILAAGFAVVTFFELDFIAGDLLVPLLVAIIGGVVVGVGLIALSAVLAPGTASIRFFQKSRPTGVGEDPQEKS